MRVNGSIRARHGVEHHEKKQNRATHNLQDGSEEMPAKRPRRFQWYKLKAVLALDIPTLMFMVRGSLPATVGLALIYTDLFSRRYGSLGYVTAIIAWFSMAVLPRAKFLQSVLLEVIFTCFGASVSLLGMYCGIKAREATSSSSEGGYNSSQAAVLAIFLFVDVWFNSMLRTKIPAVTAPVFMHNVVVMITMTFGPRFPTMEASINTVVSLLELFLIAFGIGTAVSLLVFPITTRTILFKQQAAFISALREVLHLQTEYFRSLESVGPFRGSQEDLSLVAERAERLKKKSAALKLQYNALLGDTPFAKREIAWGKLNADDLTNLNRLLRTIILPVVGLSKGIEILHTQARLHDSADRTVIEVMDTKAQDARELEWSKISALLHEPFYELAGGMDVGLEHVAVRLQLKKPEGVGKAEKDLEANESTLDHDGGMKDRFEAHIQKFHGHRESALAEWRKATYVRQPEVDEIEQEVNTLPQSAARAMYIVLYLERLAGDAAAAIHDTAVFAQSKIDDGTMKRSRLIYPDARRLQKWARSIVHQAEPLFSTSDRPDLYEGAFARRSRNPEHLPPSTFWEKYSDNLRKIPALFGSPESVFGFRVALATLSGTIMAFIRQTHDFYFDQRIIWTIIVIIVGWHRTAGQSVFALVGRVCAALVGMTLCFVIYYIPAGHFAGIVPILWLVFFILAYFFRKFPQFIGALLICGVTIISPIGNELQVKKLGAEIYHSSGEIIYPIYELAPYRAFIVIVGCVIAFFWTIFPYPVTERHLLRTEMGATLYKLADYHACCQAVILMRVQGSEGDMSDKRSRGRQLARTHHRVFDELRRLLPSLRTRLNFHRYELPIGGRFPTPLYRTILQRIVSLLDYFLLMAHATNTTTDRFLGALAVMENEEEWKKNVPRIVGLLNDSSRQVASTMALLASAVKYAAPLPPFLEVPTPYKFDALWTRVHKQNRGQGGASGLARVHETFAVLQVMSELVCEELGRLIDDVRDLVGEVDYSAEVDDAVSMYGDGRASHE